MSPYKILPFSKGPVNLFTLESIIQSNTVEKLMKTTKNTILTTVHHKTHIHYERQIQKLSKNEKVKVVPFYLPLVYAHNQRSELQFWDEKNPRNISLIVGQNDNEIISRLNKNKIITLEQLCTAFPQKVPLSYRHKDSQTYRQKLQTRIAFTFNHPKSVQFENILVLNPNINMWDEAFQVLLDCQPSPIIIPYLKATVKREDQLYRLTLDDFINGLKTIHSTVSKAVKNHPQLNLKIFDQKYQLNWLITNIAPQTSQMIIDQNFFTKQPNIKGCDGKVQVRKIIEQIL